MKTYFVALVYSKGFSFYNIEGRLRSLISDINIFLTILNFHCGYRSLCQDIKTEDLGYDVLIMLGRAQQLFSSVQDVLHLWRVCF